MNLSYPLNLPFTISQKWNENPEYYNTIGLKGHNGIDFAVPIGTPVYACHDGTITFAQVDSVMSLTVTVTTDSYETLYCHLSEAKVQVGDKVKKGDLIALSGNTGRFTTGPHLHLGLHPLPTDYSNGYNGAIDPFPYFDGTYPKNYMVDSPFIAMQKAILAFQLSEGITVFKDRPLKEVNYGPLTQKATLKYK